MIINNGDGTFTVKGVLWGQDVEETFDKLYEAEAANEQLNMMK